MMVAESDRTFDIESIVVDMRDLSGLAHAFSDIVIQIRELSVALDAKSALLDTALASCERLTAQVDSLQRQINTLKFGGMPRE